MAKEKNSIMGERLKALRKEKGISSAKALAKLIPMGESTIKQYESGRRTPEETRSGNLKVLADFYGVDTDYILGKTEFRSIFEKWNSEYLSDIQRELVFIDYLNRQGINVPHDSEEPFTGFLEYIKQYEERKQNMKTRAEIKTCTNADHNEIRENFETGEITIYAVSEADLEKGFQQLVKRGIISE